MVHIVDVPVQAGKNLIVVLVSREIGERARIVTVLPFYMLCHHLHITDGSTRQIVVGICHTVFCGSPSVDNGWRFHHFTVYKEKQFILDNRTAKCKTIRCGLALSTCSVYLLAVNGITLHILIHMINVCTSTECVGSRLGNGIHTTTDKVSFAHIVRRDNHLQLLDGIDRNRISTTRKV